MVLPGMSDGRCFTSVISNCQLNENLKKNFKSKTNNDYRLFLQKNANSIMKEMKNLCKKNAKNECDICYQK